MAKYDIFLEDLTKIKDTAIRTFTEQALDAVDDKFYKEPCSSSNKFHPPEDQGAGGIIRHVKKGLEVIAQFERRAMFSETERDIAISAFILHDSCKNGVIWGKDTDYAHGYIASEWLKQFKLDDAFAKETLLDAIRYHMAPWAYRHTPWLQETFTMQQMDENIKELQRALTQPSRVELAVREADYWSSRKNMSYLQGMKVIGPHDAPDDELTKRYALDASQIKK